MSKVERRTFLRGLAAIPAARFLDLPIPVIAEPVSEVKPNPFAGVGINIDPVVVIVFNLRRFKFFVSRKFNDDITLIP
mgnify:CR=1 FL=1